MNAFDSFPLGQPGFVSHILDRAAHLRGDETKLLAMESRPDARAYVRTLVADVTQRYRPDVVELESPSFMGFAHEFHHEKDGVGLLPEDDFLLSLCFCPSCLARAARAP